MANEEPRTTRGFGRWWIPALICFVGLLVGHREEIFSGFTRQQFDLGDTRWVNYTLEHELRWLLGSPVHFGLWEPPYFWPAEGVGAYADVMLGALAPYAFLRIFFVYDTAFLLWGMLVGVLNFAALYALLRRVGKFSELGASAGALLFAFSNLRINMTMHWQLFSHYWSILALLGIWSATEETLSPRARRIWAWVGILSISCQLWAGFYLGWFLVFGLAVLAPIVLIVKPTRVRIVSTIRAFPFTILGASVVAGLLLIPLAKGYLAAAAENGMRSFGETMTMICPAWAWLDLGPHNLVYGWLTKALPPISMEHEQRNGLGFLTMAIMIFGVLAHRKKPGVVIAAVSFFVLGVLVTRFGDFTLWKQVYDFFPGAKAVRSASRLGLLMLIPAGVMLGAGIDAISRIRNAKWAVAVALFVGAGALAEQAHETSSYDRAQNRRDIHAVAKQVPKQCDAVLVSSVGNFSDPYWKLQMDAMASEFETGVPTINGYSGHAPPNWNFEDVRINDEKAEKAVLEHLGQWIDYRQAQDFRVCHVKVGYGSEEWDAEVVSSPSSMRVTAGAPVQLQFVLKNTGTATWPKGRQVLLALQYDRDRRIFGAGGLTMTEDVPSGATATLSFALQAPSSPGVYPMQWRMISQGARWFGELPPEFNLEVFAGPDSVATTPQ